MLSGLENGHRRATRLAAVTTPVRVASPTRLAGIGDHDLGVASAVECMQRAIHNHKGDVYDPFVGSGTTVIAGEQEGRIVYAIEIEPAYVDVTVTRWEDFTGRKAKRLIR